MSTASVSAPVTILAARLFDGAGWHDHCAVRIEGGHVAALGSASSVVPGPNVHVLPEDTILAPGFIDVQVNGGGGVLLNDAPTAAAVQLMLRAHRASGTTGFLPTLITDRYEVLADLAAAAPAIATIPGVLGLHLEGPFINAKRNGVHPGQFIRLADARDWVAIEQIARHVRLLVTLAPECVAPRTIARLVALGAIVSIGHSDATAAEVKSALAEGATGVTHLFNAMSQISPRDPGVAGTAIDDARAISGLICDGIHVDPANMRTALRAAGRDRIALVSDAMPSVGAQAAAFRLHGRPIALTDGRLTAPDGTLAGAHLSMMEAVRNATVFAGASLESALIMASATPARLMRLDKSHGRIAPGMSATFTAFSTDFVGAGTWINGQYLAS